MLWTILSILLGILFFVILVRLVIGFADMVLSARLINIVALVVIVGLVIFFIRMIGMA